MRIFEIGFRNGYTILDPSKLDEKETKAKYIVKFIALNLSAKYNTDKIEETQMYCILFIFLRILTRLLDAVHLEREFLNISRLNSNGMCLYRNKTKVYFIFKFLGAT